jgi:hypothetical protein
MDPFITEIETIAFGIYKWKILHDSAILRIVRGGMKSSQEIKERPD